MLGAAAKAAASAEDSSFLSSISEHTRAESKPSSTAPSSDIASEINAVSSPRKDPLLFSDGCDEKMPDPLGLVSEVEPRDGSKLERMLPSLFMIDEDA